VAPATAMPEAGSENLTFEQFDEVSQKEPKKVLLVLQSRKLKSRWWPRVKTRDG